MKDITTTPTAKLLAEWEQKSWVQSHCPSHEHWRNRRHAIAAELDRRCSEAGIKIENGCFLYAVIEYEYIEDDGDGNVSWGYGFVPELTAKEQHDLEGWLLLKEGGTHA